MNLKSITGRSILMAALVVLPAASFAADTQTADLMKDLEVAANDIADQSSALDTASLSSNVSWQVHAQKLQMMKDDVNEIGHIVSRLEEMRGSLSAADVDSLDRAQALSKEMVSNSTAAIQFLNADQQNFWMPTYRKNISNLVNESTQLASSVSHAIAQDKSRGREKR